MSDIDTSPEAIERMAKLALAQADPVPHLGRELIGDRIAATLRALSAKVARVEAERDRWRAYAEAQEAATARALAASAYMRLVNSDLVVPLACAHGVPTALGCGVCADLMLPTGKEAARLLAARTAARGGAT